ncbi:MAG TPA: SH3 domain-containing protein [Aggregatilineaceae bacterium]|nr:SH3 domain-containing protein [Aggregatilineaceae bacterium]
MRPTKIALVLLAVIVWAIMAIGFFETRRAAGIVTAQTSCNATVINILGVNLRQDHNLNAPIIRLLDVREQVVIQGFYVVRDARHEWAYVTALEDGQTGWVAAWYNSSRFLMWNESLAECYPPFIFKEYAQNPPPTPPATWTPAAPPTPTAISTPIIVPTVEQTTLPNITPGVPKTCEVKARFTLRVRSGPGISFVTVFPFIAVNEVIVIDQVVLNAPYLWAHHERGWTAIRFNETWWVYGVTGPSETCVDVPGWPEALPPPEPVVLQSLT